MNRDEQNRLIWLSGKIVPLKDATINVLSPTAQFGANVFEGIRCYWNDTKQELYAFRLVEHYVRLQNSMKMFRMGNIYSMDELRQGLIDVIKANNYKEDIAVRQTVFIDGFGSWHSKNPVNMFIAPIPRKRLDKSLEEGLRCCISSWERISDNNISPKVKVGANYINSRMAHMEAVENGYDSAILLNNHGKVAEGTGACLFIVRNGVLITPPTSASVLESITRTTIIELVRKELNLDVLEKEINRTDLYICDEAFLCGSAVEVKPIINIDGYMVGTGQVGEITKRIYEVYLSAVYGELQGYEKWLTPIYQDEDRIEGVIT